MESLLAVAALITVGAITPGPNNLIVLRTAARHGVAAALPAVAGVVLGGLGLLAVAAAGGAALFHALPGFRLALALGGCFYLAWLGLRLIVDSFAPQASAADPARLPAGVTGLAGFQFLNPKSWVLVLTAVAAMPGRGASGFFELATLFLLIPASCLLLWSWFGALMMRALENSRVSSWFDRTMGGTLAASAAFLLASA
jgi:threonine/homoserine/homoserine lactone efflux protein